MVETSLFPQDCRRNPFLRTISGSVVIEQKSPIAVVGWCLLGKWFVLFHDKHQCVPQMDFSRYDIYIYNIYI